MWTILKKKLQFVLQAKPSPAPYSTLRDTIGNQQHIFETVWYSDVQMCNKEYKQTVTGAYQVLSMLYT